MEDSGIIKLYFERDQQAITETAAKYGALCFSVANSILENREDAEECVCDAYLGIWKAIPPEKPGNLKAFVYRIVKNISLDMLDRKKALKRTSDLMVSFEEVNEFLPECRINPDYTEMEIGEIISTFLRTQKADDQVIFIRKYFYLESVECIARKFAFGESKVKNSLARTRKRLRKYLEKEGVKI